MKKTLLSLALLCIASAAAAGVIEDVGAMEGTKTELQSKWVELGRVPHSVSWHARNLVPADDRPGVFTFELRTDYPRHAAEVDGKEVTSTHAVIEGSCKTREARYVLDKSYDLNGNPVGINALSAGDVPVQYPDNSAIGMFVKKVCDGKPALSV